MVRNYKPKGDRKPSSPDDVLAAINLVKDGWSVRQAAIEKKINRMTLLRYLRKEKKGEVPSAGLKISYASRNVFTENVEKDIADYCIQVSQMGYGLTSTMARDLAYEVAVNNNINIPNTWKIKSTAGVDWFHGFKKRHPNLSMRVPEGCSIARAMAFNQTNVKTFFEKFAEVRERHPSFKDGTRIFNLDETNTSTVQNIRKVISPKGIKQVHQVKGAERGVGVTTCVITGAVGSLVPPVMIFPRKKFIPDLLINCYPGTLGLGNAKGYMTKELFYKVMEHFIRCTGSSIENPTLLLLDNVESHFSSMTLDLAKNNGVVVFTFPPHCTHRLQPLDVGFFGPFKNYYDHAIHMFLSNHPGQPPTIYRVAEFVHQALMRITPQIIISSFAKPGIVPFNSEVFTETDFAMAAVTHKPNSEENDTEITEEQEAVNVDEDFTSDQDPADVNEDISDVLLEIPVALSPPTPPSQPTTSGGGSEPPYISPLTIRGLPKAKQQAAKRKPRRKGKCMVATDSPEKEEIRKREEAQIKQKADLEERKRERAEKAKKKLEAAEEKKRKQNEAAEEKKKTTEADDQKKRKTAAGNENKKRKVEAKGKTVSNEKKGMEEVKGKKKKAEVSRVLLSDSDHAVEDGPSTSAISPNSFPPLERPPMEGDFVIASLKAGKERKFYVGKILSSEDSDGDLEISYYRGKALPDGTIGFMLPQIPDLNSIHISDVKALLPKPKAAGTKRLKDVILFQCDLSQLKLV